jgi:protein MpaA
MTSSKSKPAAELLPPPRLRQSHNYPLLVRRWRTAAKAAGLKLREFARASGFPVLTIESRKPPDKAPRIYLSAGIHGDEPAGCLALLEWIERNPKLARKLDLRIFPCLNPWGLAHNKRSDELGRDLNRCYRDSAGSHTAAHISLLKNQHFDLALILHEDYDAQGCYIYETSNRRPHFAEKILSAMFRHIPFDPRRTIDGSRARKGVIRRRISPETMPDWPEAFALHFFHAKRTLTIETPSEFSIHHRTAAHRAAIEAALHLIQ